MFNEINLNKLKLKKQFHTQLHLVSSSKPSVVILLFFLFCFSPLKYKDTDLLLLF